MFDISFSELALCFIVALIVLGPERLPKVARTVGRWSGQARAYMRNLTTELERETNIADLKKQFQEAQQALLESKQALEESTRRLGNEVQERIKPPSDNPPLDAPPPVHAVPEAPATPEFHQPVLHEGPVPTPHPSVEAPPAASVSHEAPPAPPRDDSPPRP